MRLKTVIEYFGNQAELAFVLGVSPVAVHFWVRHDALPPKRALQIEQITKGKFKANELVAPGVLNDVR